MRAIIILLIILSCLSVYKGFKLWDDIHFYTGLFGLVFSGVAVIVKILNF